MSSSDDETMASSNDPTVDSTGFPEQLTDMAIGTWIGPYKLIQQLGEGGFGTVFMAEQKEPVQRTVALKIIKLGMDTKQVISRFRAERQALAMMDHPNIAHVLDAGATDSGRPYFVMELVKGVPIDSYCDTNKLGLRARLDLFIEACHAIQHAHQKGIIHRDLKPSNVMVSLQDGNPVPKVIDFGIAKATNQQLSQQTMQTQVGDFIGTPDFMSPEQAGTTGLDIDTRSDIYSLGVLLYQLVTGTVPFGDETMKADSLVEIQRIIREETPPRPSVRISRMGEAAESVARWRDETPARLSRLLSGDLDWIIFKAMEKDRTRRYETANAFALDLERYLNNEAIEARPPSATYRMSKLIQRNKASMAVILVIILLIIGGTTGTLVGLVKAKKEAFKSAVTAEMMTNLLQGAAPSVARGRDAAILVEMLREGEQAWGDELAGLPEVESELRSIVADVYYQIGEYEAAIEQYRIVLSLLENTHGPEHPDIVQPLTDMGECYRSLGEIEEAEAHQRRALEMAERVLKGDHEDLANAMAGLAVTVRSGGDLEYSMQLTGEALEMYKRLFGDEHRFVLILAGNLAAEYIYQGNYADAEVLFREVVDIQRRELGESHPDILLSLNNLSVAMMGQEKFAEAEPILREAVAIALANNGPDHPLTAGVSGSLGLSLLEQDKFAEAEPLLRDNLEVILKSVGADHYLAGKLGGYLGAVSLRTGRIADGEQQLLAAYDVIVATVAAVHPAAFFVANELADCYELRASAEADASLKAEAAEWRSKSH